MGLCFVFIHRRNPYVIGTIVARLPLLSPVIFSHEIVWQVVSETMSLDRRVLCARRSRHLREAPEHIDPPDDRTRQAGARPRPNPKRPWELMRRTHALNHNNFPQ